MRSALLLLLLLLAVHACTLAWASTTCKQLSSCDQCVAARGCGWSGGLAAGECVSGSKSGADARERLRDATRAWNYESCSVSSLPNVHVYERTLNFSTGNCCEFSSCKDAVGRGCCLGNERLPCTVGSFNFTFIDPLPKISGAFSYIEIEYRTPTFVRAEPTCREMFVDEATVSSLNGNPLVEVSVFTSCLSCFVFDSTTQVLNYVQGGMNTFQLTSKTSSLSSYCGTTVQLVIRAFDDGASQSVPKRADVQRCSKFTRRGCHQCTMQSTCGWDRKAMQCVAGDIDGPEGNSQYTAASDWFFSSCPEESAFDLESTASTASTASTSNNELTKQFVIDLNLSSCCDDSPFCCFGNPSYTSCSIMSLNATFDDPLPANYKVDKIVFDFNGTLMCDQDCLEFYTVTDLLFYVNIYLGAKYDVSSQCGSFFAVTSEIKPESYYKYGGKNTATITRKYRYNSGVSKFCPHVSPTLTIFGSKR